MGNNIEDFLGELSHLTLKYRIRIDTDCCMLLTSLDSGKNIGDIAWYNDKMEYYLCYQSKDSDE